MTLLDVCRPLGVARWILAVSLLAGPAPAFAQEKRLDFSHDVVPILRKHCAECHAGERHEGGFSINTRVDWLDSGYLDPDDPQHSRVWELITSADEEDQMPPRTRSRVPAADQRVLLQWFQQDVPWEEGFSFGPRAYEPPLYPRTVEVPQTGFANPIDNLVQAHFDRHAMSWPAPIGDAEFLRRASLDLVGLLPAPERVQAFVRETDSDKRRRAIDRLLADDLAYAEHWMTLFNDLLRNDYSGTGFITGGRRQITGWLYRALLDNKRFDQFTRELIAPPTLASRGFIDGIRWRGDVSAGQTVEIQFAQSVGQAFLGINLKCASCHDSFIDRWTLEDAYGLAAIYAQRPLELYRCDVPTGRTAQARWLFPELGDVDPAAPRDQRLAQLAELMTHRNNGRFSRTIVNRIWHRMMGRGIVHPVDAMQTEPWSEDLLDFLAEYLVRHDYDLKSVMELIADSRIYQSRCLPRSEEVSGGPFRGPLPRRLTAEQFLDAVWQITGTAPTTYDAPVIRGIGEKLPPDHETLSARWVWASGGPNRPPGEQIVLRGELHLESIPRGAWGFVSCDNEFDLYVNRRLVTSGKDWGDPTGFVLRDELKKGNNELVLVARNAGQAPNPAGVLLEMRLRSETGDLTAYGTDGTWKYSNAELRVVEGRLQSLEGPWREVDVLQPLDAWQERVVPAGERLLTAGRVSDMRMIRASLLKNNNLMRTLGRPHREQIVSMRPDQLTTLEAIELANDPTFTQMLAIGAQNLLERLGDSTQVVSRYLFQYALTREPTGEELRQITAAFGERLGPEETQDLLWATFMQPDFFFVR